MRFIFLLLFTSLWLGAYEGLSLAEALKRVEQNNIELSIARMDEEIASYEHSIAQGSAFGSLDLTQTAIQSNEALSVFGFKLQSKEVLSSDFDPNTLNNPKAHTFFQTALEYKLPLYSGGAIETRKSITEALKMFKQLDKEKMKIQKIFEVKKTFYTLSLLESHQKNLYMIASNTDKMEALTQSLYKEGYAKYVDLLEIKARKSDIQRLLHQTHTNHTLMLDFLSFLLNEKIDSIMAQDEDVALFLLSENEILEHNIDIKKAAKGVDVSSLSLILSESAFLPKVGAFARYATGDNRLWNAMDEKESYTIGLQASLNVFNGGSDKSALEKARVEVLKAKQNLSLAQKATVLHYKKIVTEIENDTFAIKSLKDELILAHAIYENYAGRYSEKLVSIHEVLLKQSEELEKMIKLREVQNRRNEKIFELETMIAKEHP